MQAAGRATRVGAISNDRNAWKDVAKEQRAAPWSLGENVGAGSRKRPGSSRCGSDRRVHRHVEANADLRFDRQAFGGPFYGSYADALADVGAATVDYISFDVDGGWAVGGVQTVLVDNFRIDGVTYTYEPTPTSKDSCKKGGWQSVVRADGSSFKNQGDCIQYVNTGK